MRASQASRPRESSLSSRGFTGPARRPSPSGPRWLRGRRSAFPPGQSPQGCLDSLLTNSLLPRLGRGHFLQPGQKKAGPDRQGAGPAAEAADPGPQAGPAGARGHRGVPRLPPPPPQLGLRQLHPFSGSGGSVKGRRWPEPLTADPGALVCWTDSRSLSCRLASLCFLFIHLFHGFGLLPGSSGRSQAQDFGL